MAHLQKAIDEAVAAFRGLTALEEPLNRAAKMVLACLTSGHKLLVCGNGGSASDATHFATEFLCRFCDDRRPYPAISLTANGEFMTAVCNDYAARRNFRAAGLGPRRRKATCSSRSRPAANPKTSCARWKRRNARASRAFVFSAATAASPRAWRRLICIVPGTNTARIQEAQKLLYHVLCEMVDEKLPKA